MNPTQANLSYAESLCALVDGEAHADSVLNGLQDAALADWNIYQTIGDVLKTPGQARSIGKYGADPVFVQRLMHRLENVTMEQATPATIVGTVAPLPAEAANDTTFRWKLVAGFASFGAVATVAWTLMGGPVAAPEQLASSTAATELVVASPQGPVVRDARLEELLSAHKQLGSTTLQVPSGFLRNAGFESPNNGRR